MLKSVVDTKPLLKPRLAKTAAAKQADKRREAVKRSAHGEAPEGRLGKQRTTLPLTGSTADFDRRQRRRERMELQREIRSITSLDRLKACGHAAVSSSGVTVRGGLNGSGLGGVATCGSGSSCPNCSAKIAFHRGKELGRILKLAEDQGKSIAMVTLTVRHKRGDSLKSLWDGVTHAWARVTSGKGWKASQERMGLVGWARATEVTHGKHGFHVHVHAVLVMEKRSHKEITEFGESMFGRWSAGLANKGFTAVANSGGLDVSISAGSAEQLGHYVTKMGGTAEKLALEATHGALKKARGENRSPFQIIRDFFDTGDTQDLAIWLEWERGSKGRKMLTWSKNLRAWAKLETEKSDEEIAAEDLMGEDLVLLPPATWAALRSRSWEILDYADKGRESLIQWLDSQGMRWLEPVERL